MRYLLTVGGELHVIGLAENKTIVDKAFAATLLLPARIASILHRERPRQHLTIKSPGESFVEIRQSVVAAIPGAEIR